MDLVSARRRHAFRVCSCPLLFLRARLFKIKSFYFGDRRTNAIRWWNMITRLTCRFEILSSDIGKYQKSRRYHGNSFRLIIGLACNSSGCAEFQNRYRNMSFQTVCLNWASFPVTTVATLNFVANSPRKCLPPVMRNGAFFQHFSN